MKVTFFRRLLNMRESGILLPLLALSLLIGIINPTFFKFENIMHVLKTSGFLFIPGVAITFVLVSAGLDLSIGLRAGAGRGAHGHAAAGQGAHPDRHPLRPGHRGRSRAGQRAGHHRFKIPSLIVTLGMMYLARGIVEVLTRGQPRVPPARAFQLPGPGHRRRQSHVVIIAAGPRGGCGHIFLTQTRFGRAVFAVGGNEETARLSGINVNRVKTIVYMSAGGASALRGAHRRPRWRRRCPTRASA